MTATYDSDFYAWTQWQAYLLKTHQFDQLDLSNLVEEIESLGRQEQRELENRLAVLLAHLLKWQYQSHRRSNSWMATIREQRYQVSRLLRQNPSLKPYLEAAVQEGYRSGCNLAVQETGLAFDSFPEQCPYPLSDILQDEFLPS